jgi:hypothetical protein
VHFTDLSPCRYHSGAYDSDCWRSPLLAVGWLEHPHAFPTGAVPDWLCARIVQLNAQFRTRFPSLIFRGWHKCSLCLASDAAAEPACPDVGAPEYREALRAANGGVEAPLYSQ